MQRSLQALGAGSRCFGIISASLPSAASEPNMAACPRGAHLRAATMATISNGAKVAITFFDAIAVCCKHESRLVPASGEGVEQTIQGGL